MTSAEVSIDMTPLAEQFEERCADPSRTAIEYFDARLSYGDLAALIARLRAHLAGAGVAFGDRVVIQQQNTPEFVIAALASWGVGAVVVPVSPMYGPREVGHIVRDSGAIAWIGAASIYRSIAEAALGGSSVRTVVLTDATHFAELPPCFADAEPQGATPEVGGIATTTFEDVVAQPLARHDRVANGPEDIALIAYTSGTTGAPKGAMLTHRNIATTASVYAQSAGVERPGEKVLALAPLIHITGFAMHLGAWIATDGILVLGYRFEPDVVLDLIERARASWTTGASTAYIALLRAMRRRPRDTRSLRYLGCGGAPVPTAVAEEITRSFGTLVHPGYGLTESTGGVVSTPLGETAVVDAESGVISVGLPLPGTELVVRREDGSVAPPRERGEVTLRGPSVMAGYWRNPDATAETIRDGWLHTGDVGFVDEEGRLFLVDRTKNVIIASGYKVWPREVEDVLYSHPDVREAAVVGSPDAYRGETVKAYIVRRDGGTCDAESLISHCRAELAAYKVPKLIEFLDELPKNPAGKILHRELREHAAAQVEANA